VIAAWSETMRDALDWADPPVCAPVDWLLDDRLAADWLADDPLVDDRLVDDWPATAAEPAVLDVLALLTLVIARVTAAMRSAWLRVSACWSRWICCRVGAVRNAPMHAVICAADGAVVGPEVLLGDGPLGGGEVVAGGAVVGAAVVLGAGGVVLAEGRDGDEPDGKNGTH